MHSRLRNTRVVGLWGRVQAIPCCHNTNVGSVKYELYAGGYVRAGKFLIFLRRQLSKVSFKFNPSIVKHETPDTHLHEKKKEEWYTAHRSTAIFGGRTCVSVCGQSHPRASSSRGGSPRRERLCAARLTSAFATLCARPKRASCPTWLRVSSVTPRGVA